MSLLQFDDEIEACFREDPSLYNKTLKQLAKFFMIQGEVKYSLLKETLSNRAEFYRMRLREIDSEYCDKLDKEWREICNGTEKSK